MWWGCVRSDDMSVRTHFPSAKEPDSHFFFTVSRGGRQKRFALRPGALYSLAAGLPLLGAQIPRQQPQAQAEHHGRQYLEPEGTE